MDQSENQQKVYILHGYWDTPDYDGVAIVKVSAKIGPAVKALDQVAESKAREYIEMYGYLQEDRGDRHYEVTNGEKYAKFYITEEVINMRNDLIRAILGCGIDDLSLLDDAEADMFEIISRMKENGQDISLMGIVEEIFKEGILRMGEAVKEVRERLEYEEKCGSLTEAGYEQLEAIRSHNLNPEADFQYYLNFLDTHLNCDSGKKEVYEEMFEQEMQDLMDYTGFNIEG